MDVLHTLYDSTKYEFQFLVDHSCGHDRQHPDGLNMKEMNKLFGGEQRTMHDSDLTDGCIGIYNPRLQIGSKQSFIFKTKDDGPFYLHETSEQPYPFKICQHQQKYTFKGDFPKQYYKTR